MHGKLHPSVADVNYQTILVSYCTEGMFISLGCHIVKPTNIRKKVVTDVKNIGKERKKMNTRKLIYRPTGPLPLNILLGLVLRRRWSVEMLIKFSIAFFHELICFLHSILIPK